MKQAFFISLLLLFNTVCFSQSWFNLGTGTNALKANYPINTICTDDTGNVYAAGNFTDDDNPVIGRGYVAKWSVIARNWQMLGIGSNALKANLTINTICADKHGNIYAAGGFTDSTYYYWGHVYVAKWNGTEWVKLGTGTNALNAHVSSAINSICVDDSGNVYAAGNLLNTAGYFFVAKWNGATWVELTGLYANNVINTICVDDSLNVYAGGYFTDGYGKTYIAKWDRNTSTWSGLGSGFDSSFSNDVEIRSLYSDSANHVCAAVNFQNIAGVILSNVFKWRGTSWSQLGALNGNNDTRAICKGDSGFVYATGAFTNSIGQKYVAKYNPITNVWNELGTLNPHSAVTSYITIATISVDKYNNVYTAGTFTDTNNYFYVAEYGIPLPGLGISFGIANTFEIFPNPTNSEWSVSVPDGNLGELSMQIFAADGKLMHFQKLEHGKITNINAASFATGLYYYRIVSNESTYTGSLIKN